MKMKDVIVGQECICPDGIGKILKVNPGVCDNFTITVKTRFDNRECDWDSNNVKLVSRKEIPIMRF